MASIETVRKMVQSLVVELNGHLKSTGYRVMFHQQNVNKGNMSLFVDPQSGRNKQRLYIHPATKYGQYKIVLSGMTLAVRQKEFELIFDKKCDGYVHPDSTCPYWYIDDPVLVKTSAYLYIRPFM
ncbi:hypothetical protein [Morganella morganii]|uniref:hypothetical protein n=1 Tax=Morganella morganii TaxID=582 RepID=UPI00259D54B0|nr:hypothetical protein [Morganella morganii]